MDRTFWPAIAFLLAVFAVFEATDLDLRVQDHFYNFSDHAWLVNQKALWPRLLFYTGPKALLWIFAFLVIGLACAPARWRVRLPFAGVQRLDLWSRGRTT